MPVSASPACNCSASLPSRVRLLVSEIRQLRFHAVKPELTKCIARSPTYVNKFHVRSCTMRISGLEGTTSLWLLLTTLTLLCIPLAAASSGDDMFIFDDCVFQCQQLTCFDNPNFRQYPPRPEIYWDPEYREHWQFQAMPLPWYLRILQWDCPLNCDYQCQRILTKEWLEELNNDIDVVLQFHGKWPFWRVFGIQELVSAIFSLGNFVPHYLGYRKLRHAMRRCENSEMAAQYYNSLAMAIVTMMAWIASTVFHIRDFKVTEKLDYFLAGLTVLTGFHGIAARAFKLYLPGRRTQGLALTTACLAAYTCHVWKLLTDWLYTYNMQANIVVALLQNGCWCLLCYELYSIYYAHEQETTATNTHSKTHLKYVDSRHVILPSFYTRSAKLFSLYPLLLATIVGVGMSLEIFDFAPFFHDLIDAHALWHLVTIIPASYGLYDWLIWDINEHVVRDLQRSQALKDQ